MATVPAAVLPRCAHVRTLQLDHLVCAIIKELLVCRFLVAPLCLAPDLQITSLVTWLMLTVRFQSSSGQTFDIVSLALQQNDDSPCSTSAQGSIGAGVS
jgi:hypothetical protein